MRGRAARALSELGAAAPIGAVCLLAANDHQLKGLFHNALTGKLSDVAICFLIPLLVSAALGIVSAWPGHRRLTVGAIAAIAVFTLLELSDAAGAIFVHAAGALGLGGRALTRDPTDLLALICVPLAVVYGCRRVEAAARGAFVWRSATGALVLAAGALSLMATSKAADCDTWSAPVVFQAEAGCGPGGVIVVDADSYESVVTISNAPALGLPSFGRGTQPYSIGAYRGGACPFTLAQGGWDVTVYGCPGVDAGAPGNSCSGVRVSSCRAELEGGELWFVCGGDDGGAPTCRSRLTEMP